MAENGLVAVELCRILNLELGISLQESARIAAELIAADAGAARYATPSGLTLVIELREVSTRLRARVPDAIETLGEIKRGRPAARLSTGDA